MSGLEPFIALASLAATVGGTVASAAAASNQASYQAQVAKNNEILAKRNADYAENVGAAAAQDAGIRDAAQLGRIKAAQGASGVDVNEGSPVDVYSSSASTAALDQLRIRNNATLSAIGSRQQASNFADEAKLDQSRGEFGVASSLLNGVSSLSSKWSGFKQQGVFTGFGG